LGVNLVGANRVIVFDASWNPANDTQAIFRTYRYGQKRTVYVYRLIASGTMEKKIYERQMVKQGMSLRVVDEHQVERLFNRNQTEELWRYDDDPSDPANDIQDYVTIYDTDGMAHQVPQRRQTSFSSTSKIDQFAEHKAAPKDEIMCEAVDRFANENCPGKALATEAVELLKAQKEQKEADKKDMDKDDDDELKRKKDDSSEENDGDEEKDNEEEEDDDENGDDTSKGQQRGRKGSKKGKKGSISTAEKRRMAATKKTWAKEEPGLVAHGDWIMCYHEPAILLENIDDLHLDETEIKEAKETFEVELERERKAKFPPQFPPMMSPTSPGAGFGAGDTQPLAPGMQYVYDPLTGITTIEATPSSFDVPQYMLPTHQHHHSSSGLVDSVPQSAPTMTKTSSGGNSSSSNMGVPHISTFVKGGSAAGTGHPRLQRLPVLPNPSTRVDAASPDVNRNVGNDRKSHFRNDQTNDESKRVRASLFASTDRSSSSSSSSNATPHPSPPHVPDDTTDTDYAQSGDMIQPSSSSSFSSSSSYAMDPTGASQQQAAAAAAERQAAEERRAARRAAVLRDQMAAAAANAAAERQRRLESMARERFRALETQKQAALARTRQEVTGLLRKQLLDRRQQHAETLHRQLDAHARELQRQRIELELRLKADEEELATALTKEIDDRMKTLATQMDAKIQHDVAAEVQAVLIRESRPTLTATVSSSSPVVEAIVLGQRLDEVRAATPSPSSSSSSSFIVPPPRPSPPLNIQQQYQYQQQMSNLNENEPPPLEAATPAMPAPPSAPSRHDDDDDTFVPSSQYATKAESSPTSSLNVSLIAGRNNHNDTSNSAVNGLAPQQNRQRDVVDMTDDDDDMPPPLVHAAPQ
jgi:hypothetical protein